MKLKRYNKPLLLMLAMLLGFAGCDYEADVIEYQDVLGVYDGQSTITLTVGVDEGIDWPERGHMAYGDTILPTAVLPDTVPLIIDFDTDNVMSFLSIVPTVDVLGRNASFLTLYAEDIPVSIKGNHVVTWDMVSLPTESMVLPIKTLYVELPAIEISFADAEGNPHTTMAQGYLAAMLANYSADMDLMIESAPGLLTPGCTLWITYKGVMVSRDTFTKDDLEGSLTD